MSSNLCQQVPYTLGLDIGVASVGAALLSDSHILSLHVRTFDKAETDKDGESLNKIRRDAKSARKRLRRRSHRLLRLRRLFKRVGLTDTNSPNAVITRNSPWQLRAEGLDRLLQSDEWAGVLYHLLKHRGFQSTRKSELKNDEKAGQMLSGVKNNQQLMAAEGYRSVGELAARHEDFAAAKRNKGGSYSHTFARADIEQELHLLFEAQRKLNNPFATPEIEQQVHTLLMQRRPALTDEAMLKMLGRCTFEPDEYRAPKAGYSAERFVWLTRLNNLRLSGQGITRELTPDERNLLLELPFTQSKLTYKQVRNKLELDAGWRFIGLRYPREADTGKNPEDAALFEAKGFHALGKAYKNAGLKLEWQRDSQNPERLDQLAYALTVYKEDHKATQWLLDQGIVQPVIDAVLSESFSDFVRLSSKALQKILPFMQAGQRYDEALQLAGYEHHSQLPKAQQSQYIPRFGKAFVANPVVARALNQARKLVNAIIREYGTPRAIHIELARDLSRSFKERKEIEREQGKYRDSKLEDIAAFEKTFRFTPKGLDLLKWRLYREQNSQCAYSLKPLDLNRLFEVGYVEVDHALPYSRSFNDGLNNKVLVLTEENRNKGNRTPYEYLDGQNETPRWQAFAAAVNGNPKYREAKKRNLLRRDFSKGAAEEFRERNLSDTRYIARSFKTLVENHLQLEDKNCVVVSGQLTAFLRTRWGLLKVREDGDKHHALDAAVVAACSRSMVKRLSDYSRRKELQQARQNLVDPETGEVLDLATLRKLEAHFPEPWPHFRNELQAHLSATPAHYLQRLDHYTPEQAQSVQPLRVSRAATRRGLGQAHQETIRSAKLIDQNLSSVRTPLENLKLKDLPRMVGYEDPRNQTLVEALEQRLQAFKDDGKKAFAEPFYKPAAEGKQAPLVRSVKLATVQKSGLPVRHGIASNGDMLRIDVFSKGGKYFVVPLYVADAVAATLPCKAVVAGKPEDLWDVMDDSYAFLFSLYPNDWVQVELKGKVVEGYYAGMNRSTGAINLWAHDRNQAIGKNGLIESIGIKTAKNLTKYHVDILGRLHRVEQEPRQPLVRG